MMDYKFRDLRADEIDVRIGTARDGGVSLLLYKDARCDMNILDETVGPMNWQRQHCRENANCIVSLWDEAKQQWISKEDTGTESNTEAEKGLASDSFKRACFNWGIGRELYTAPFIWVKGADKSSKFRVKHMEIKDKRITALTICYRGTDEIAYTFPGKVSGTAKAVKKEEPKPEPNPDVPKVTPAQIEILLGIYKGANLAKLLKMNGIDAIEKLPRDKGSQLIEANKNRAKESA